MISSRKVVISLDLVDLVLDSGAKSVAIVGTAKNVGKTVTMNYLSSRLTGRGLVVGLVSSGRDGEITDAFTGEPKPSIVPPEGAWIATAEGALGESAGFLEIADIFDKAGLLGRLVIGRMRESGPVELVGPQNAKELARVVERLRDLGARVVLVDGALDRVAAASPGVTGAVVLSTGASAHSDLTLVAKSTASIVRLWSLKTPDDPEVLSLARRAIDRGYVAFLDKIPRADAALLGGSRLAQYCGGPTRLSARGRASRRVERQAECPVECPAECPVECPVEQQVERPARVPQKPRYSLRQTAFDTVLGREEEVLSQAGEASFVVVPGAVGEAFLAEAEGRDLPDGFSVIAKDPTALFTRSEPGVPVYVAREIRLLAITVNPVSGGGFSYEPREMVGAVSREVCRVTGKKVPVFDVVSGESNAGEVYGVAVG